MFLNKKEDLSEHFATMSQIILECIEAHSETILQIFDFNSLLIFLRQLDQLFKEKGTQII